MIIEESSRIALKLSTCGRWREGAKKEGEIEPLRRGIVEMDLLWNTKETDDH